MHSVTIGIAAYNEEKNIEQLLHTILQQQAHQYTLSRIHIVSDASTDKTDDIVQKIAVKDARIFLQRNVARIGKALTQNTLLESCMSDYLLLLDADVFVPSPLFISDYLRNVIDAKADLSSAKVTHLPATSLFEHALASSMEIKNSVFGLWRGGDNILTCHGRARMLSRRMYEKLRFPVVVAEDAYSYLFCKTHNMQYAYIKSVEVQYQLPRTFTDHFHQSKRYFRTVRENERHFGAETVRAAYLYPKTLMANGFLRQFARNPLSVCVYLCIVVAVLIFTRVQSVRGILWDISQSTKKLQHTQ